MSIIRILPEDVSNRIAAGEVVERPASIVKELLENSLDAGARRISIHVERGGRSLVRLIDDGCGMDGEDALMCLEQHATSKIRDTADIEAIHTLGFRGEALPSIASVSRFTLVTRPHDAEEGTKVEVHGGAIREVSSVGAAPGTSITVRSLFYNMPARRKFLRGVNTEEAHIQETVLLQALAHPEVGIELVFDRRTALAAQPGNDLRTRATMLLGREVMGHMLDVEYEADEMRVYGFVARPGLTRSSRREQRTFVNGRPVDSLTLYAAVRDAYNTMVMKGRYSPVLLFIEVPPDRVDINVHPAKREVRFRDDRDVGRVMGAAVRHALRAVLGNPERPGGATSGPRRASDESADAAAQAMLPNGAPRYMRPPVPPLQDHAELPLTMPETHRSDPVRSYPRHPDGSRDGQREVAGFRDAKSPSRPRSTGPRGDEDADQDDASSFATGGELLGTGPAPWEEEAVRRDTGHTSDGDADTQGEGHGLAGIGSTDAPTGDPTATGAAADAAPVPGGAGTSVSVADRDSIRRLRVIGVLKDEFLLAEGPDGLVLVDQHAAHERVLFEQFWDRAESKDGVSQGLLIPVTIDLSATEAALLKRNQAVFAKLGFELEEFGGNSFLITAVPPHFPQTNIPGQIRELLDDLYDSGSPARRLDEHAIATAACKAAVKAHDPLKPIEIQELLDQMLRTELPYTCPHGRPTMIAIGFAELEKRFGRRH